MFSVKGHKSLKLHCGHPKEMRQNLHHPKFGLGMKTDDATHTPEDKKRFITQLMRLSGESKVPTM